MTTDVLQLASDLIAIKSVSQISNVAVSDRIEEALTQADFTVERLTYTDDAGFEKVSLVGKKGEGQGGLGFFSHSDTVPGAEDDWAPYDPVQKEGRLLGRGSCDMKGPLAATMTAAMEADVRELKQPLFVVVAADEEVGYGGARQIAAESELLNEEGWPTWGVIAEPTELRPVYAHKGGYQVSVTAHGRAAHTSTDRGISANFLIAPFLAEMAELVQLFKSDERFMNHEFEPPTNGFNMVMTDHGCASNVTAARTDVKLSLRAMPDDGHEEAIEMIMASARKYNLEASHRGAGPFYTSATADIVQAACRATEIESAETVPFGTEAMVYQDFAELVVLGPGNIAQAHTVGEFIDIAQLTQSVDVYGTMIRELCG
ncbi:MAG: M20/M25/M40 family metallo-hydrolase [Chloroflexota bacterium]